MSALNTLTIANLTGDDRVRERTNRTLARYGPRIGAAGRSIPMMLCALSAWYAGHSQVVIVGDSAATRALRKEAASHYLPFSLFIPLSMTSSGDAIAKHLPFTAAMTARDGAAAYVCRDFACRQPVTTVQDFETELELIPSGT